MDCSGIISQGGQSVIVTLAKLRATSPELYFAHGKACYYIIWDTAPQIQEAKSMSSRSFLDKVNQAW